MVLDASDSLLVRVLIDLHTVDADLFTKVKNSASAGEPVAPTFLDHSKRDSVLSLHHLTEADFSTLIEDRLAVPERFLLVYNQVLDQSAANQ